MSTDDLQISPEGLEGAVPEALSGPAAIDAESPGFLSLVSVLEAALEDAVDMGVMVAYHNELTEHLHETREALERTPVPPEIQGDARPMVDQARAALADLEEVLALLGDYLGTANLDYVRKARKLLLKALGDVPAGTR